MKTINLVFIFTLISISFIFNTFLYPSDSLNRRIAEAFPLFETTSKDFGKVYEGTKVTLEFPFKNDGSEKLIIYSSKTSCGCTVANFTQEIEAGKIGNVKISLDTKNRVGKLKKQIWLSTNSMNYKEVELTITGEVVPIIYVEPQSIFFSEPKKNQDFSTDIDIKMISDFGKSLKFIEVITSKNMVNYKIKKIKKNHYILTLIVDYAKAKEDVEETVKKMKHLYPDYSPETEPVFSGFIQLKTNITEKPSIIIYFTGLLDEK